MATHLTHGEIVLAAQLIDAVRANKSIRMLVDNGVISGSGEIVTGTLRHFSDSDGSAMHADTTNDIRSQYVHVTRTFEHWYLARDILEGMANGWVAFD